MRLKSGRKQCFRIAKDNKKRRKHQRIFWYRNSFEVARYVPLTGGKVK